MDVEEIANAVRAAVTAAGRGRQLLDEVATDNGPLGEARDLYNELFARTELEQLGGHVDEQRTALAELMLLLGRAQRGLEAYVARITGPSPSEEPQAKRPEVEPEPRGRPEARTPTTRPAPMSQERLDELRAELPPPVVRRSGKKTHGRWVDGTGKTHVIVSESDEWRDKVNEYLTELGCDRVPIMRASDVELRLAAKMRQEGETKSTMRHVTLAINNVPCEGPYSCDRLLPVVLPKGYTITVHGTDGFVKTYTGGDTPPWQ